MKKIHLVVLLVMSLFIIGACSNSVSEEDIYKAGAAAIIRDISNDLSENFFTRGEFFKVEVSDQNMVTITDLGNDVYQVEGSFFIISSYPTESGTFEIKIKFIDGKPSNYEWSIDID